MPALSPLTPAERSIVDLAAALKGDLVEFALSPPLERPLREKLKQTQHPHLDPFSQRVEAVESLLFEHAFDDGSTVLDRFVARQRPDGPRRDLVESWSDDVHGIFEVVERRDEQLVLLNLFDELTYRAVASMGPESVDPLETGWFVITRVLPVGSLWLLSGTQGVFPPDTRPAMAQVVATRALENPALVLRSPDKLAKARATAAALHESFLTCFGRDTVIVPGPDVPAAYQRFLDAHRSRVLGDSASQAPHLSVVDDPDFLEGFIGAGHVAIMSHPESGVSFFVDFPLVETAFRDPTSLKNRVIRHTVDGYVRDESIPAWLFDRLCAEHPDNADVALATVMRRPGFSWAADGAALMREYRGPKIEQFAPSVIPVPTIAEEHLRR